MPTPIVSRDEYEKQDRDIPYEEYVEGYYDYDWSDEWRDYEDEMSERNNYE